MGQEDQGKMYYFGHWDDPDRAFREYQSFLTGLAFLTKYGTSWNKDNNAGPVTQEMRKLLNRLGINGHRNFYTLRHTFRTVADESKDRPSVDFIMGHEVPHMSAVYRATISDERLRTVADHVRRWLFPSMAFVKSVE